MNDEERKFLELLLEKDWIPFEKLRRFVAMVDEFKAIGVQTSLKELLLARGILTKQQVENLSREVATSSKQITSMQISPPHLGATKTSSISLLKSADLYSSSSFDDQPEDTNVEEPMTLEPIEVAPPGPQIGATFSHYKVLGEIGKGGMATIYEVWDSELRRTVAMKVLTLKKKSQKATGRFVSEAQATAQLQHPNIIPIHDIGWTPEKLPYFTMDVVRGHSLESVVNHLALGDPDFSQVYPRIRLLNIFIKICEGVSFAHSKGVIHRDLKPQNIMVGPFGEVYIMDWGLAKFLKSSPSGVWTDRQEEAWVTQQGAVVGTPTYMAPEQARGEVEKIDERTDVYTLSSILYELLTFRSPFISETIEETYHKVLHADPPDPQSVSLGGLPDPRLSAISLKGLSKDKAHRYPTVAALKQDVQSYLDEEEVGALPDNVLQKSIRFLNKYRWPAMGALTALLVILLFWNILSSSPQINGSAGPVAQAWKLAALEVKPQRVLQFFEEALKKARTKAQRAWILREKIRYRLYKNNYQGAEEDLLEREKIEPDGVEEFFIRFAIATYKGNVAEARNWLNKIIEKEGDSPYLSFARGRLLLLNKGDDLKEALPLVQKALSDPRFQDPLWGYLTLAQIHIALGRQALTSQEGEAHYQRGEEEFQKGTNLFLKEAILYLARGEYYLLRYEYLERYVLHGNEFQKERFFTDTMLNLNGALKLMPENGYLYFLKGRAYFLRKEFDLSNKAFEIAKNKDGKAEWVAEIRNLQKSD